MATLFECRRCRRIFVHNVSICSKCNGPVVLFAPSQVSYLQTQTALPVEHPKVKQSSGSQQSEDVSLVASSYRAPGSAMATASSASPLESVPDPQPAGGSHALGRSPSRPNDQTIRSLVRDRVREEDGLEKKLAKAEAVAVDDAQPTPRNGGSAANVNSLAFQMPASQSQPGNGMRSLQPLTDMLRRRDLPVTS
jgi:hypothetical protein